MYYNLSIEDQVSRIFNNNKMFNKCYKDKSNNSIIKDITDGLIYKRLFESNNGKWIKLNRAYTFLLNTDGIAVSDKSNLTIWPVYLALNELPIENCYCIENVIIAGKCL